jgi:hypothetical protein
VLVRSAATGADRSREAFRGPDPPTHPFDVTTRDEHEQNGEVCIARPRGRRTGSSSLSGRARPANLRERLQGSVAALGEAPDHAAQRIPAHADRAQGA